MSWELLAPASIAAVEVAFREETTRRLSGIVERFSEVRALVVGDAIVDQYHFGRVDRMCPEAPVPIFLEDYGRAETRRGGADNVAHQLEAVGCEVRTVFATRRSVKHRYFAGHHLVFRRDSDSTESPGTHAIDSVRRELPQADVVVLSDYAKGFLTAEVCDAVMNCGVPVIVDPKGKTWFKYHGATVICPNSQELALAPPGSPGTALIEKRGSLGLRIWQGGDFEDIRATAQQVYDVTGAGDTVTALVAAAIAAGAAIRDAALLANAAAGVVVGKLGTAVCDRNELFAAL